MEGRGVTNYDVSKPNFNITTSTTEFDDELMRRNIASFEQCMIGKGATPQEARRLAIQKKEDNYNKANSNAENNNSSYDNGDNDERNTSQSDESSYVDSEDEDDMFMAKYRTMRLQQFKEEHLQSNQYGLIRRIRRSEWTQHVNEASKERIKLENFERRYKDDDSPVINPKLQFRPVVVFFSPNPDPDPHPELQVEKSIEILAKRYPYMEFVKIDYKEAIPNWPIKNLPTLFVYQGGEASHQLIGVNSFISSSSNRNESSSNDGAVLSTIEKKFQDWGLAWYSQ